MTIKCKDGIHYQILYTLRKEGSVKNDLVTDSIEKILEYLAAAHRCDVDELEVEDISLSPQPSRS